MLAAKGLAPAERGIRLTNFAKPRIMSTRRGQTNMATMNISLPDSLKSFVEAQVTEGGYGSTSEYFRELVREARKRKAEQHLETLLLEGLEGEGVPATPEFWDGLRSRVRARSQETE